MQSLLPHFPICILIFKWSVVTSFFLFLKSIGQTLFLGSVPLQVLRSEILVCHRLLPFSLVTATQKCFPWLPVRQLLPSILPLPSFASEMVLSVYGYCGSCPLEGEPPGGRRSALSPHCRSPGCRMMAGTGRHSEARYQMDGWLAVCTPHPQYQVCLRQRSIRQAVEQGIKGNHSEPR